MSRMSDLHLTIQEELLSSDKTPQEVADLYDVPVEWVRAVVVNLCDFQEFQPDEAQEWHDFDPDC